MFAGLQRGLLAYCDYLRSLPLGTFVIIIMMHCAVRVIMANARL